MGPLFVIVQRAGRIKIATKIRMSVSYLPVRIMALVSIVSVPINVIVKLVGRIRTVSKIEMNV